MIDLLRRRGMIPAIVLACAAVTVITWAGLATLGRESPRATPSSAPTIHAPDATGPGAAKVNCMRRLPINLLIYLTKSDCGGKAQEC